MSPWQTLPHPSDLRVRVLARDRRELFAEAARSTFALSAVPRRGWPAELETRALVVSGANELALLHQLLADCVFELETHGFLARDVVVDELAGDRCRVRLLGARFEPEELVVDHVIKAVTWHGLAIRDEADGVSAEILHDL